MKNRTFLRAAFLAALVAALPLSAEAWGAQKSVGPDYICAELVANAVSGQPPILEGLQMDGFAAAMSNENVADPLIIGPIAMRVYDACQARPTDKVLDHWREARKDEPAATDGPWRADKTTCGDYLANEDDGGGFIIWLDAWRRGKDKSDRSVLSGDDGDRFVEFCKKNPGTLALDAMKETFK